MNTILIDGDVILYQVASACEISTNWGDDLWTLHADAKEAKQRVDITLSRLYERLDACEMIITLSGAKNFRKEILPTYKGNRKKTRKPVIFPPLKEYLREIYTVVEYDNLEGDDVLGLIATGMKKIKGDPLIVSIDKDMKTIPAKHYNPDKDEEGIFKVTLEEADYFHLYQSLMGDQTDGYSGCPGIGPKTAAKILDKECSWSKVKETYEINGLTEDDALVQARVARILRHGEYNPKTQEINLWQPR